MSARRQTPSLDQPVRFYKIIALTFLCLTLLLLGIIVFMSSKRATIVIESKASPVDVSGTVTIGKKDSAALVGSVTSTIATARSSFAPTAVQMVTGTAVGQVTLHNETSAPQALIVKTRLLTPEGILFRLNQPVTVPAKGTVVADVYADQAGPAGDIGPAKFTIPGLSLDKQAVIYATSESAMKGGVSRVGIVSRGDMDSAEKKIREQLQENGKQSLQRSHSELTGAFLVDQVIVTSTVPVGGEASEFVVSATGRVVGVFTSQNDVRKVSEALLEKRAAGDSTTIVPGKEAPVVTIETFDVTKGEATATVFGNGTAMLNPNSKQLEKSMFFGKSRDEVRRYLVNLDHVRGVDIKFSPAWMLSVPYIADHVEVIVKQVE